MVVGGSFLLTPIGTEEIFTREKFTDEQKEFYQSVKDFVIENVLPNKQKIEKFDIPLVKQLIKQFADLGFGSIDIESEYGGMEMDKITSMLVTEALAYCQSASWAISFGAHVGIGTLPIAIFGNKEQKKKYLPELASADKIGAYCLTEPGSGSDALAAKCTAYLSEDGKFYTLNGTKQFITNGGFADIYIVFAKINGDLFSGFIVERGFAGVSHGLEEHKMGLKGSSTTTIILENVKVPAENLLWKIGKGHEIAFNILNLGRLKLGVGNLGGCKVVINEAFKYAKDRKQFGRRLADFDMIKSKFADMIVRTYALDSMAYNATGKIHDNMKRVNKAKEDWQVKEVESIEDYAIEASMLKVYGSESLAFCTDTGVQILGGYGFTEEYPMAQMYRDTRVDRIYEGTNEINRQVIAGYYLKNALMEKLPVREYFKGLQAGLKKGLKPDIDSDILPEQKIMLEYLKMFSVVAFNEAISGFGQGLKNEQMILEDLANMFTELFALESTLARVTQRTEAKINNESDEIIARILTYETIGKIKTISHRVMIGSLPDAELRKTLEKYDPILQKIDLVENIYLLKQKLADAFFDIGEYTL